MSTKEEIFNYVMNSPENTNPAVLGSLLNGVEGGGAGLPEVTTDDNGNALRVVNGEWQKTPIILDGYVVQAGPDSVMPVREDSSPIFNCDALLIGGKLFYRNGVDSDSGAVTFQSIYYDDNKYIKTYKAIAFTLPTNIEQYQRIEWTERQLNSLSNTGYSSDAGKIAIIDDNGYWSMSSGAPFKPKQLIGQFVRAAGNKIMFGGPEVAKDIYDAWAAGFPYRMIISGDYEEPFEGNDQLILTPSVYETGKITYTGIYRRPTGTSYYRCTFDGSDTSTYVSDTSMTAYTVNDSTSA